MRRRLLFSAIVLATFALGAFQLNARQTSNLVRGNAPGEWRYWGGDAWSTRYSPLDQINAANFKDLAVKWQWNAGAFGEDEYYRTTPLYANGRLFTVATTRRVTTALDPETGETLWMYRLDEGIRWQKAPRQFAGRGLAYWNDGRSAERVITITPGYHLVSLDAKTGRPAPGFGTDGVVDLMDGLGLPLVPLAVDDNGSLVISDTFPYRQAKPGEKWDAAKGTGADGTVGIDPKYGQIAASSPAIIVNDVIIVGNSSIHGYYPTKLNNLPGFIRGFDVRTGKQLWKFNLVPQDGEFGRDSWKVPTKPGSPGVGKNDAWAPYSADPDLGLVYVGVGMPLMDEYGGHRPGDNLFGNSIVAIDVKTGKRKWHFQMVHHDIWDYDVPMAPNLMDVTIDGRVRKVVAQTTKQGWIYTFDRATGDPIWPMPETPVMQSDVKGEMTSPTQPIPSKPAPYSQQGLVESDVIDYTPEIKAAAMALAKQCRMGPYFIPGGASDAPAGALKCAWYAPGASGGVNIDGGAAFDPETGMIYVGGQSGMAAIRLSKDPCSEFNYSTAHDSCGQLGAPAAPAGYVAPAPAGRGGRGAGGGGGRLRMDAIQGVSIVKPKEMGGVTAYNMNTGDKVWWIPNGGFNTVTPEAPAAGQPDLFKDVKLPPVGAGGQPQVINTKTLVVYGTGRNGGARGQEPKLFAVDKATGKEIAAVKIPSKTTAVPMTFMHKGKQYIVFATGSGANTALVAMTLPGK